MEDEDVADQGAVDGGGSGSVAWLGVRWWGLWLGGFLAEGRG